MHEKGVKIGLEIHGYLKMTNSKQKLFCTCLIDEKQDEEPNRNICPVCTGQPGSKPNLPNKEAVDKVIKCALMLDCKVNRKLIFQRKHYSYPDLPNNYQKTMSGSYSFPVGEKGVFLGIGITECHLEEDPARYDLSKETVDFNRCGYPLIEIVTEPDFRSSDQVKEWLKKLLTTLSYIDGIYKNMGIKCDVNVSIEGHPRVEVKNVNSPSSIIDAIEYELKRQSKMIADADVPQYMQTRGWDDLSKSTWFMRKKETATQYMFIPEPDLPIVEVDDDLLKYLEQSLPLKPDEKKKAYLAKGLSEEQAEDVASDILLSELFDKMVEHHDAKLCLDVLNRLKGALGERNIELSDISEKEEGSGKDELFEKDKISECTGDSEAKMDDIFKEVMLISDAYQKKKIHNQNVRDYVRVIASRIYENQPIKGTASLFIEENESTADESELDRLIKKVIEENPSQADAVRGGDKKQINYLVGQVMKITGGKSNPGIIKQKFEEALNG